MRGRKRRARKKVLRAIENRRSFARRRQKSAAKGASKHSEGKPGSWLCGTPRTRNYSTRASGDSPTNRRSLGFRRGRQRSLDRSRTGLATRMGADRNRTSDGNAPPHRRTPQCSVRGERRISYAVFCLKKKKKKQTSAHYHRASSV